MNEIVFILDDTAVTNTLAIAAGTENEHASVIKLVRTYLSDLEEFGGVRFEIQPFETTGGSQTREIAILNEQHATLLMTYMRNSDIVRAFKKQLVKAFFELAKRQYTPVTKTRLELAKEQVRLIEQLEETEKQLQVAILTKAEIGSRREATAMATASNATQKANRLEIELDKSKDYCTIKRMQMIYHGQTFDWRKLKATSIEMGVEAISVFDQNYGSVKAYHRSVWYETYALTF